MNHLALAFAMFAAEPAPLQNSDKLATPDLKSLADRLDKDLKLAHERMDAMQKEIDELRKSQTPYTAKKPVEATTASVMLVNDRSDMMFDAIINGVQQSVSPGQRLTVSVPAGSVSLQLITTHELPKMRMLQAGTTHVVTLR